MRLRELRKAKKLSMKQLGNLLNCSESTISLYETGKREPNFETLLKMGEILGVSVDYLLGNGSTIEKDPAPKERISDEDIKFALFGGANVTDAQFEEVKRFARFIAEKNGG